MRTLRRQGCRSVGLIAGVRPLPIGSEQKHRSYDDLLNRFVSAAGELGMELRNEWMRLPDASTAQLLPERRGYTQFQRLMGLARRPAGLLVVPESESRGVALALAERRVRVPQDLKLVLTRNRGMEFFVPAPVTFADMDAQRVAQALLEQIQHQLGGETCQLISIPFEFVSNEGHEQ